MFITGKLPDEFHVPENIRRITLRNKIEIFQVIEKKNLDILVYNLYLKKHIHILNKLKKLR